MGMIMHDDVPYGEGTSYTAGTGIAINNNIIAVDADNAPAEGSEKPVKSKGVHSALESNSAESASLLKSTVGWTGKNLLGAYLGKRYDANGVLIDDTKGVCSEKIPVQFGDSFIASKKTATASGKAMLLREYDSSGTLTNSITVLDWNQLSATYTVPASVYYIAVSQTFTEDASESVMATYETMIRKASITDDTYEPYHESVEEEIEQIYADNGVLGAKNLFNLYTKEMNPNINKEILSTGIRVFSSNKVTWYHVRPRMDYLPKNTNLKLTMTVTFNSGNPLVEVVGLSAEDGSDISLGIDASITSGDVVSLDINTGNYKYIDLKLFGNQGGSGSICDVSFTNIMLRLASDPDDTYVPYAMTNRELTEKVAKSTETFGQVEAYRNNGVVMLKFTGASITEADGMTLGTLSEKYRPIVEFRTMTKIYNGSSYVDVQVNINTSGVVKLMSTTGQAIENIQPRFTLHTPVFIPSIN